MIMPINVWTWTCQSFCQSISLKPVFVAKTHIFSQWSYRYNMIFFSVNTTQKICTSNSLKRTNDEGWSFFRKILLLIRSLTDKNEHQIQNCKQLIPRSPNISLNNPIIIKRQQQIINRPTTNTGECHVVTRVCLTLFTVDEVRPKRVSP